MTSGGIFGTIESVDDEENRIVLKTGPTSQLTIHRPAVGRVVTPVPDDPDSSGSVAPAAALEDGSGTAQLNGESIRTESSTATAPEYGELSVQPTPTPEQPAPPAAPRRRPARASKRSTGE